MSVSGGGRASLAAGLAEALHIVFVGALVSAGLAALHLVGPARDLVRGYRGNEGANRQPSGSLWFATVTAAVAVIDIVAILLFARHLASNLVFTPAHETGALVGAALSAAIVITIVLITAYRFRNAADADSLSPLNIYSLLAAGAVGSASAVLLWRIINGLRLVAMGVATAA
jgi:hypothetical protein